MERGAGVLLHVTSLADGTFKSAFPFIDFLAKSGIKYWQVLAFGPTGYGDSPYSPLSVFALNPNFTKTIKKYDKVEVEKFIRNNKFWIEAYAAYMTLKEKHGLKDWLNWSIEFRDYENPAVKEFVTKNQDRINYHIQVQMNLYEQWMAVRKYANEHGVKIIGDIPIYPAMDSADVWANKGRFEFKKGLPTAVAGVGPDYFNKDGQLWGNPLYDFSQMAQEKYKWWISRMKTMQDLFDIVRIDHFRAFDSYYKIPYNAKTARVGEWVKGPGMKFFNAIKRAIPNAQIILEDLGEITPSVVALRDKTGYPGMKVMQFGFDGNEENEHLPKNYPKNCVAYIGTHDNDTFMGFLKSLDKKHRGFVADYLYGHGLGDKDKTRLALEDILQSQADIVIIPMQDFLFQDAKYRMNTPGTTYGNWKYCIRAIDLGDDLSYYIKVLIERSKR